MKKLTLLPLIAMALLFFVVTVPAGLNAQTIHGVDFVDEDGDGYNDNAPDADGDGIPNGMDPDYVRVGTGSGYRHGGAGFIDEDGDGINDNAPDSDGDGIPNGRDEDYAGSRSRRGGRMGGFVDEDGDGFNDNAPDEDGDGIPNYADEDYECTGQGIGRRHGMRKIDQTKILRNIPNQLDKQTTPSSTVK